MLNQTNDLSMLQNSQYINASFLNGGLNASQFNKSKIQSKAPGFFANLKSENTGESKMEASEERFALGH
jgi:hypothetical protein